LDFEEFGIIKGESPDILDQSPQPVEDTYRMFGFASSPAKDYDGEQVIQKGLNIEPLVSRGWVDWDHDRLKIIGWVNSGDFRPNPNRKDMAKGLYVEYTLNKKDDIAQRVWNMAKSLEEVGCPRRFGLSLEGQRKSAKSGKVFAADIYGLAITPYAKNIETSAHTFMKGLLGADIGEEEYLPESMFMKGFDEDRLVAEVSYRVTTDILDMIKALMAGYATGGTDQANFAALRKESLQGKDRPTVEPLVDVSSYLEKMPSDLSGYQEDDRKVLEKLRGMAKGCNGKLSKSCAAILGHTMKGYPMSKALKHLGFLDN